MAVKVTPTVIPATEEMTYDELWLKEVKVEAFNPNGKVKVSFIAVKTTTLPSGFKKAAPEKPQEIVIEDFFADLANHPRRLQIFALILEETKELLGW